MTKNYEIAKMLTISTSHITEDTDSFLAENECNSTDIVCYRKGHYGWFIFIPEYPLILPDDLGACVRLAKSHGCEWLCLDRDADVVELPTY